MNNAWLHIMLSDILKFDITAHNSTFPSKLIIDKNVFHQGTEILLWLPKSENG